MITPAEFEDRMKELEIHGGYEERHMAAEHELRRGKHESAPEDEKTV